MILSILYNKLAYYSSLMTLFLLIIPLIIPQPQIDGIRYIERVGSSFGLNVTRFLVFFGGGHLGNMEINLSTLKVNITPLYV